MALFFTEKESSPPCPWSGPGYPIKFWPACSDRYEPCLGPIEACSGSLLALLRFTVDRLGPENASLGIWGKFRSAGPLKRLSGYVQASLGPTEILVTKREGLVTWTSFKRMSRHYHDLNRHPQNPFENRFYTKVSRGLLVPSLNGLEVRK